MKDPYQDGGALLLLRSCLRAILSNFGVWTPDSTCLPVCLHRSTTVPQPSRSWYDVERTTDPYTSVDMAVDIPFEMTLWGPFHHRSTNGTKTIRAIRRHIRHAVPQTVPLKGGLCGTVPDVGTTGGTLALQEYPLAG